VEAEMMWNKLRLWLVGACFMMVMNLVFGENIINEKPVYDKSRYKNGWLLNKKGEFVRGANYRITDEKGHSLEYLMVLEIGGIGYNLKWTEKYADKFQLPYSVDAVRKAIMDMVYGNIEYFELYQDEADGSPFPLLNDSFGGRYLKSTKETDFGSSRIRINYDSEGFDVGRFYLVFSPGYYPEIIYKDYVNIPEDRYEFDVKLREWSERKESLKKRPYVIQNFEFQMKLNEFYEKREKMVNNGTLTAENDPLNEIREIKKELYQSALKAGNKKDAAWLLNAVYQSRRPLQNGGYENSRGDFITAPFYTVRKELLKLYPESIYLQAWYDEYKAMMTSPMGLNVSTARFFNPLNFTKPRERVIYYGSNTNFEEGLKELMEQLKSDEYIVDINRYVQGKNENVEWSKKAIQELIGYAKKYEKEPLLALETLNLASGVTLVMKSPKVHKQYYTYRMMLWKKLLEKYPSVYWFSMDRATDNNWAYQNVKRKTEITKLFGYEGYDKPYPLRYAGVITNGKMPWVKKAGK
jgi:hypothetical protein